MDDQKLKDILSKDYTPEIDVNARKRAVNLAVAAFKSAENEKNQKSSQGVSILSRLMGMSSISKRRETMEQITKRKLIYGGMATAMAVIFVAAISVSQMDEATQRFNVTTPPGANEGATPAYVAAVEANNETELEEALKTGSATAPVAVQSSKDDAVPLERWRKLQEERDYMPGRRENKDDRASANNTLAEADAPAQTPMAPTRDYKMGGLTKTKKEAVAPSASNSMIADKASGLDMMERRITESSIYPTPPMDVVMPTYHDEGRDKFTEFQPNTFKQVAIEPVSTFSSDVDTASYSFVRRQLNSGILPEADAVRIEEMVNYFDYNYPLPESQSEPFKPTVTVIDSPWAKGKKLMHVGIKGYDITDRSKPHTNIVFLLDVSGSMDEPNKLPLVKASMKMLLDSLKPNDTVAIAVYAGAAGTVLEPTKASQRSTILYAIDNLNAGGSTAGEAGIRLAYQLAEQNFDNEGINRIILATDGDFNVGTSSTDELKALVEQKRESGIFLSVLGFGQGNYNDSIMQTLAQNGNGVAAYIDTLNEARKVLVQEASSSLFPIAKDVKFQVEFNPATVSEYRLVGYETRALNREDFNNDRIDAGDIGAGHTVTAIYEFVPVGSTAVTVDALRYGKKDDCQMMRMHADPNDKNSPLMEKEVCGIKPTPVPDNSEYAFLKIRYKLPNESTSKLITTPVAQSKECGPAENCVTVINKDVQFSTAVAAFGQILKNDPNIQTMTLDDVIAMAEVGKGEDPFGYRAEFINLVRLAKSNVR